MEDKRTKAIRTIAKLMAITAVSSGATKGERENADVLLQKLMVNYAIDMNEIKMSGIKTGNFIQEYIPGSEHDKVDYESSLAHHISLVFDCNTMNCYNDGRIMSDYPFNHWMICIVGYTHDVAIATYFFKYVRRTMYAMCRKEVSKENINTRRRKPTLTDIKNAQRNYCFGFVQAVGEKLQELYLKRNEILPSESKDLIIIKHDETERLLKELFPKAKMKKTRNLRGDISKYYAGSFAGSKVSLARPINERTSNNQIN